MWYRLAQFVSAGLALVASVVILARVVIPPFGLIDTISMVIAALGAWGAGISLRDQLTGFRPRPTVEEKDVHAIATTQRRIADWFKKQLNKAVAKRTDRNLWVHEDKLANLLGVQVYENITSHCVPIVVLVSISPTRVSLCLADKELIASINDQNQVKYLIDTACKWIIEESLLN